MTRIVAGRARGRRLVVPDGAVTRPTSDRVREAMFSTLTSLLGDLTGMAVLDLFAGSGGLGLEALSRGAARSVLVERDRAVARTLRRNVDAVGLVGAEVVTGDAATYLAGNPAESFDLVLLDPPYAMPCAEVVGLLERLVSGSWLADGGVVVLERAARQPEPAWPSPLGRVRERRYGETVLWYLRESDDHDRPAG
jgi:16S rRNA (guanine966-N2)-methyltransferase